MDRSFFNEFDSSLLDFIHIQSCYIIEDDYELRDLVEKNNETDKSTYKHITFWDTRNIKDMSHLFKNKEEFNCLLLWNVSNVENMICMFCCCINFNQPLNNWIVSNVESMEGMFLFVINSINH